VFPVSYELNSIETNYMLQSPTAFPRLHLMVYYSVILYLTMLHKTQADGITSVSKLFP
jgi:hypothetical protein